MPILKTVVVNGQTLLYVDGDGVYMPVGMQLTGSKLVEQQTEADASVGTLTFSANFGYIEIVNLDPENAGTFTVNAVTINVPAAGGELAKIDYQERATTVVKTNGSDIYAIAAPTGYIARLQAIGAYAPAPAGATTGSHELRVVLGATPQWNYSVSRLLDPAPAYGSDLLMKMLDATTYGPINGVEFDDVNPLNIGYFNVTDADQTGTRVIQVAYSIRPKTGGAGSVYGPVDVGGTPAPTVDVVGSTKYIVSRYE